VTHALTPVPQGPDHQPARAAAPAHGVRARQAHAVVVDAGAHRDRLPVRGRGLQLHHHARALRGHEHGLFPQVHGARGEGAARLQALQGTGMYFRSIKQ
jgi:hypothetical protein